MYCLVPEKTLRLFIPLIFSGGIWSAGRGYNQVFLREYQFNEVIRAFYYFLYLLDPSTICRSYPDEIGIAFHWAGGAGRIYPGEMVFNFTGPRYAGSTLRYDRLDCQNLFVFEISRRNIK
jgi:hypothetical protein